MDPLTILALLAAASRTVQGLVEALGRAQRGETLTDEDRALLKQQQALAKSEFDDALGFGAPPQDETPLT